MNRLLSVIATLVACGGYAAGTEWAVVLERADKPAEALVWSAGPTNGVTAEVTVSETKNGQRTAFAKIRNVSKEWRVKRFYVRPFTKKITDDYRGLYFPAGLGVRFALLPDAGAGRMTNGWVRAERPDGENRYVPYGKDYIHLDSVYPCCWTSMEWLAFDFKDRGVYWGCHDPQFTSKRPQMMYDSDTRELTYEVAYELMLDPGKDWTSPPMVESEYAGDWHKGADIYRAWLDSVSPATVKTPRGMSGQLLCILKQQNGDICWPYTEFDKLADTAIAHGLDWVGLFGWTVGGHDHLYPDYDPDPAMGGREALVRGIKLLHDRGLKCYIYANGKLMERDATEFWNTTGKHLGITAADGTQYTEEWNKFEGQPKHAFSMACPYTEAWYQRILMLARQANELGADGILYDQLANADPSPCYATNHGHLPGAMSFASDKSVMMRRLKRDMSRINPDFMFMSEGIGDTFRDSFSFFHGMCTGAHTSWDSANVMKRFNGGVNPTGDYYPEILAYTLPDIVSTARMANPFMTRSCVNYCAIFALRFEIEVRYRPDRQFVDTGVYPGDAAYKGVLAPPELNLMTGLVQRASQDYMKLVADFRNQWREYLLLGEYKDTVGIDVEGVAAKRFEAKDGTSAILVWNTSDRPVVPRFRKPAKLKSSYSPERGKEPLDAPIPPNSLRLYL